MTAAERQDATALKSFYEGRAGEPLWITKGALNERAMLAIDEILKAADWGLDPSAFSLPTLAGPLSQEGAVDAELALSHAALTYARHARGGRVGDPAKQLSSHLDRRPQMLDPKHVLEQLAVVSPDIVLRSLHPKHPQFERLRQLYVALLEWSVVSPEGVRIPKGPAISPGEKHKQVVLLRERLDVPLPTASESSSATDAAVYDESLVAAVKAFQTRKAISADGIVGPGTRAALNNVDMPDPEKIRANMEMWRWMPDDLGSTYIWVNLPELTFQFVRDGKVVLEDRIVAGPVGKPTPVFSATMDKVTINPRWNVPDSIKVTELHPRLARGDPYFHKQGFRMSLKGKLVDPNSVDWSNADIREFDVQQLPGLQNEVGKFRFSIPNRPSVYFHDGPANSLVDAPNRLAGRGTMKIRNPSRLTEVVLEIDKGWTPARVSELVEGPVREIQIPLDTHIPIHVVYFTQRVDDDGAIHSFTDIYGHEKRLVIALSREHERAAKSAPSEEAHPKRARAPGPNALETFFSELFGGN